MKKLIAALCVSSALVLAAQAEDTTATPPPATKLHKMTPEQTAVMKDMLAKYDANKDGKLDDAEKAVKKADEDAAKTAKKAQKEAKKG